MGAEYVGVFSQVDLYFRVPEGRLKLREVKGSDVAELIYYNREDIAGPKSDDAYLLRVQESEDLKVILKKILKQTVVVEKVREIYSYQGTQIHLDIVKNLGKFIEFERKTAEDSKTVDEDRVILEQLMETLEIDPNDLVTHSYSDLAGA
jgi:adenylate cyclase class 2